MPSLREVNLGIVCFTRIDKDDEYMMKIRTRAKSIEQCIGNDGNIFDLLCHFILSNKTKKEYEKNFNEWEENVRSVNKTYKIANIDEFINSVKNAYEECADEEVSDLRGRLFEVILEKVYSEKYKDSRLNRSIFHSGCQIKINGDRIEYNNLKTNKSKKTVDIAGYDMKNSEFYEAKVGPGNFDSVVVTYLNILKKAAVDNNICDNISVGCMTMEIRARLQQNLMKVKRLSGVDYDGLEILGRENIKEIICNS